MTMLMLYVMLTLCFWHGSNMLNFFEYNYVEGIIEAFNDPHTEFDWQYIDSKLAYIQNRRSRQNKSGKSAKPKNNGVPSYKRERV
jgi:hypothetical protein